MTQQKEKIDSPFPQGLLSTCLEGSRNLSTIILTKIDRNLYRSFTGTNSLRQNYKTAIVTDSFWTSYHLVRIVCQNVENNDRGIIALKEIYPVAISEFRKQYNSKTISDEYLYSRNSEVISEEDFNSKGGMAFENINDIGPSPGGLLYHFSQRISYVITGERRDPLNMIIISDLAPFFGMTRQMLLQMFEYPINP